MPTYTNIATGQVLTQDEFSALVCNETYTCCNQADGVWFTANDAKNEYQWQQYFIANNLCSDGNAPINTVAPAISGTLVVGNVLTCSTGTWTSDTGIIPPYTYQWYRGATLLVGETNNTYTLVALDMDENIKCVVTACDSDGCTNANSNSVLIPTTDNLTLTFSDFDTFPSDITDFSSLAEWNAKFSSNYTSISVVGFVVTLIGGSGVTLSGLAGTNIISIVDTGSVVATSVKTFWLCADLISVYLPVCTYIDDATFDACTSLSTVSLPVCTNLGSSVFDDSVFSNITSNTITLTIPIALMTCNFGDPDGDIQYLQANNTVTIVTV
jgi:hypothetical protein